MGQSISTEMWKEHLYNYWSKHGGEEKIKILDGVDWNVSENPLFQNALNLLLCHEGLVLRGRPDASCGNGL